MTLVPTDHLEEQLDRWSNFSKAVLRSALYLGSRQGVPLTTDRGGRRPRNALTRPASDHDGACSLLPDEEARDRRRLAARNKAKAGG